MQSDFVQLKIIHAVARPAVTCNWNVKNRDRQAHERWTDSPQVNNIQAVERAKMTSNRNAKSSNRQANVNCKRYSPQLVAACFFGIMFLSIIIMSISFN